MFNKKLKQRIRELEDKLIYKQKTIEILNSRNEDKDNVITDLEEVLEIKKLTKKNGKTK